MSPTKIITGFFLSLMLVFLSGCNPESKYSTEAVKIFLDIDWQSVSSSTIKVNITPAKDVYYYCGIIEDAEFNYDGLDYRFMEYELDMLYADYIIWRRNLLMESSPYVASFSSHCLCYGKDSRIFSNLKTDTEYLIYAFCVNPDTKRPMGDLVGVYCKTTKLTGSDITFAYSIEHKSDGVWLTLEPSNDDDEYMCEVIEKEDLEMYSSPAEYMRELADWYHEYGGVNTNQQLKGFYSVNIAYYLYEWRKYLILIAGYDGGFTTPIYYDTLVYDYMMPDTLHVPFKLWEE